MIVFGLPKSGEEFHLVLEFATQFLPSGRHEMRTGVVLSFHDDKLVPVVSVQRNSGLTHEILHTDT